MPAGSARVLGGGAAGATCSGGDHLGAGDSLLAAQDVVVVVLYNSSLILVPGICFVVLLFCYAVRRGGFVSSPLPGVRGT